MNNYMQQSLDLKLLCLVRASLYLSFRLGGSIFSLVKRLMALQQAIL